MPTARHASKSSILQTVDTFVTAVPWGGGDWRCVLVYRRQHGGRTYIRLRTWNKHRTKLVWYPNKRFFVIPIENAKALADALCKAAAGRPDEKPDWLVAREEGEEERSAEAAVGEAEPSGASARTPAPR